MHHLPLALLISTAVASACAPADGEYKGQQASQLAPTCEPLSASVSGIAFNNEEATRVVDMIDNATKTELRAIEGIGAKTADRIVDGRPYRSLQEPLAALDQVAYVGPKILTNLLEGSFEKWCALADGRQSCCIELACDAGTSVASVDLSADDAHTLLDWANRANLSELDAVCGIGPSIAQSIVSARPLHSTAEVLAVPRIGNTTLFKILGKAGLSCSKQGSVADEWCGLPDAQCLCDSGNGGGTGSNSFFLDEDAAFSLAEEAAGQFYLDSSDSIWEEYCQGNYDESQGYDEQEVMVVCDEYLVERFIPAAFEGALVLVGIDYGSEQAAHQAAGEYVEDVFDAQVGDWAPGFPAAVDAALGN